MKKLILLSQILVHTLPVQAQQLVYGLFDGDKRIGEVYIKRENHDGIDKLESESIIKARFILSFRIYSYYRVWNDEHGMVSSYVKGMRNETVTGEATGYRYGNEYVTISDDEVFKTVTPVTTSLLELYYEEPVGLTKIFSERGGVYLPIKSLGNHRYELTKSSGRPTIYTYEDGIPNVISFSTFLGTVIFRLEERN